jgi:hypothetical protein
VAGLREELDGGYQIARLSPSRRRHLGLLGYYATAADQLDLAVRDTRVLARAAVTMVRERGAAPGQLPEAILELALAVEALVGYLEQPDHPLDDARHSVLKERNDLETSALVAQIRSTAVDLLRASGMGATSSRQALEGATRHASEQRVSVEHDRTGAG